MAKGKKRPLVEESPDTNPEEDSKVSQEKPEAQSPSETSETQPQFTIVYKPQRSRRKSGKAPRTNVENATTAVEENPLNDGVDMIYSVRPKKIWADLKTFRNFMVGEETFTLDQHVYVNHSGIAHGEDLSGVNPRTFWIARVLEIRAMDTEHVYLRVFWLYWPDELPGGAQPYHGRNELVASNHMEILDAMTVTGHAYVQHWRESDDEENPVDLFWRQTYDCQTQQLSALRKHCICDGYYNPDSVLVSCSNPECKLWLHKECILKDVLSKVYSREIGKVKVERVGSPKSSGKSKKSRPSIASIPKQESGKEDPWEGLFDARLVVYKGGRHKVAVTDLRDGESSSSGKSPKAVAGKQSQGTTWEEDIYCLGCQKKIV